MTYRITGLNPEPFRKFFGKSDAELEAAGVIRYVVDNKPGFPDRVTMQDLEIGDTALLLNFEHLPVESPYRACHAIFVKEGAEAPFNMVDQVPEVMTRRVISLRAIDGKGHIVEADLAEGAAIDGTIRKMFENADVDYIHAHYAQRGCFSGLIERA